MRQLDLAVKTRHPPLVLLPQENIAEVNHQSRLAIRSILMPNADRFTELQLQLPPLGRMRTAGYVRSREQRIRDWTCTRRVHINMEPTQLLRLSEFLQPTGVV